MHKAFPGGGGINYYSSNSYACGYIHWVDYCHTLFQMAKKVSSRVALFKTLK